MFEIPSPYSRPSLTNGSGWKPGTPRSHGSRPEYDVSMWPLNISVFPPPVPGHVPSTFARPSSTWCHCGLEAHLAERLLHQAAHRLLVAGEARRGDHPARALDQAVAVDHRDLRQDLLSEQLQLPEPVLAPELEHHVRAAGLLVLLDRGDAVLGRAGDRLALVEDLVGDRGLGGQPSAGFHRLRDGTDLVLCQARALEQRVGGALDVLDLVGEVHAGDLPCPVATALSLVVYRGNNRAADVERIRIPSGGLHLLADVSHEGGVVIDAVSSPSATCAAVFSIRGPVPAK